MKKEHKFVAMNKTAWPWWIKLVLFFKKTHVVPADEEDTEGYTVFTHVKYWGDTVYIVNITRAKMPPVHINCRNVLPIDLKKENRK